MVTFRNNNNGRRNNHNASKLIEKYSNLAREALSGGDKILSENYFQHADHFTRILSDQEILKKSKILEKENNNQNTSVELDQKKVENSDQKEINSFDKV